MPHKRSLTGRVERLRHRQIRYLNRTKNNWTVDEMLRLDIDNVCRCCLQSTFRLSPLFVEHGGTAYATPIVEIISQLTNCNVRQEDGFPQFICKSCMSKAHNAHKFKKDCELAQQKLVEHFANIERGIKTEDLTGIQSANSEHETMVKTEMLETDEAGCSNAFRIDYKQESELIVKRENTSDNETETEESNLAMYDKERETEGTSEVLYSRSTLLEVQLKSEVLTSDPNHPEEKQISQKCEECNQIFSRTSDLETHIASVHNVKAHYMSQDVKSIVTPGISPKKPKRGRPRSRHPVMRFKCQECNKGFSSRFTLKYHKRTHTGERPYICLECGKAYTTGVGLKAHLRMHTGERPFVCELCNKAFAHASSLYEHKRVHSSDKPYTCSYCNKRFARIRGLTTHQRTHTGEKPFECEVCNKRFAYYSSFNTHKRLHTGEKPYKCQDCDMAFVHYPTLKAHKKLHIKEEPVKIED